MTPETPEQNDLLPDNEPFFPKGSTAVLVVHFGVGLFFLMAYFALHQNIETVKILILTYYTLFSVFFLFFYHEYLRVRRIYNIWLVIAFIQLAFYFINAGSLTWNKWAVDNVLSALTGLPVVLVLYKLFRRMSIQKENKDLVIGIRELYQPTAWDKAASIIIPLIAFLACVF